MHQRIPGGPIVLVIALLVLFCVGLGYRAYNLQEAELNSRIQLKQERESTDNLRKISRGDQQPAADSHTRSYCSQARTCISQAAGRTSRAGEGHTAIREYRPNKESGDA